MATVFFSDVHIGDPNSKHSQLLDYLQSRRRYIDKIVIVGDFLDLKVASIGEVLSEAAPMLRFLSFYYQNKLHYLVGDHDSSFLPLKGIFPFIHKSLKFPVGNHLAVVLHGQLLDTPQPHALSKIFPKKNKIDLGVYEQNIVGVFSNKFDYIITGYTHEPCIKKLGELVYINLGDQIEHNTVLIAQQDYFYLYDYINKKTIDLHKVT